MSKEVDFINTNLLHFDKIIRPETINRTDARNDKKSSYSSIKITKSFVPEKKSSLNEALRPEIQMLKQAYRKQLQEEKKSKALLAEGKITRQQYNQQQKVKKQEPAVVVEEKITIDQSGQIRDEQGNLLFMKNRTTDLLINKKKEEEQNLKLMIKKQKIKLHQRISRSFLDRNLIVGSNKKRARRSLLGLQFLEKGSYQSLQRKKEIKEQIQNLNDIFDDKNKDEHIKIIKKRNIINLQFNKEVPNIEWWDKDLINQQTFDEYMGKDDLTLDERLKKIEGINIDDFIRLDSLGDETYYQKVGIIDEEQRIVLPMYLTKDERKKLKRQKKHQKLLQKNDKIKLGLIEPDKPKLRVGNMAIVMKNQFILDPSKIEGEAKKQTEERVNKHLQTNSVRKLTKTQKKDKAIRKLKRDSAKECRRAIFKLRKLNDPTELFKVNMNAKQLTLNGFIIKPSNELSLFPTMVLVQGGLRAVKFYKNLMLNRIRWGQKDAGNQCKLVWQGQIQSSTAGKWRLNELGDEVEAIRLLTEKKLEYLWDYVNTD